MAKASRNDIYAARGSSRAQRALLTIVGALYALLSWWLLAGGGITIVGTWLGHVWNPGAQTRRFCLAGALTIYYVRLLFTQLVFLKRAVSWAEASMIALWLLYIYLLLDLAGGTNPARFTLTGGLGVLLFLLGSWMNSYAEYARHNWKARPENRGKLYTGGLFRVSRHPNYLGDLISFSGLCFMAGRWITVSIPGIMFAGFVFSNIPMLDSHLHDHYGAEFDAYAARTSKLIPFLY